MNSLKTQSADYRYCNLVYSCYSLVAGQPYCEMWNTLTTSFLGRPDLFGAPTPMNVKVETEGYWQGTLVQDPEGRRVSIVLSLTKPDEFYSYVLDQLKRN